MSQPCPSPPVPRSAFAVPRSADRPPSLSAAQIDAILAEYHSPAVGLGAVLYDLGAQYGIDPAFALAFFVIESACGTRGVARTTHSLGNIRCTPGYACAAGYRAYPTWAAGAADWYTLIRTLYLDTWDLRTPAAILPRYAPPGDGNDPAAYATSVIHLVDRWATAPYAGGCVGPSRLPASSCPGPGLPPAVPLLPWAGPPGEARVVTNVTFRG
jgi:hypothetical protein